jgi:hypothetical protein
MSVHVITHRMVTVLATALLLAACSESADDDGGSGGNAGGSGSTNATTSASSADASSTTSGGAGGASASGHARINEISATEDWVELFAQGGDVDLGGFTLADQESPGVPKLDEGLVFPEGTQLAEGEVLVVVGKFAPPAEGLQTTCLPDGGPETCYQAAFGISDGSGDALFVIDPEGTVVEQVDYPAGAAADGESWARIPDGTGPFQAAAPSPGAANGT